MKHDLAVTLLLIFLFLASHLVGLFIINHYLPKEQNLPLGIEKPQLKEETSYLPIFITIIIATIIALILMRLKALRIWKTWYFLSIFITLLIAFGAFAPELIALIMALIFAIIKLFKNNTIIHNFTEVFIYGGLAAIFVPVLSVLSIIILLILISIYDIIAVWKTKHMISMAKFQAKSKIFAGLFVPYGEKPPVKSTQLVSKNVKLKKHTFREAILGGGDIAFPLMFSGVMLKTFGFGAAAITSITAALALFFLFAIAEKKKFYPAMPFITAGSLIGYFLILLAF